MLGAPRGTCYTPGDQDLKVPQCLTLQGPLPCRCLSKPAQKTQINPRSHTGRDGAVPLPCRLSSPLCSRHSPSAHGAASCTPSPGGSPNLSTGRDSADDQIEAAFGAAAKRTWVVKRTCQRNNILPCSLPRGPVPRSPATRALGSSFSAVVCASVHFRARQMSLSEGPANF